MGTRYTAAGRDITLSEADANNPRIDIFIADRFGNIFASSGIPSADPVKPTINFQELEITQANISAGATEPASVISDVIYDEGTPEEWATSYTADTGISILTNDTSTPNTGAKNIALSISIPDEIGNSPTHFVGERYQGGIIFHLESGGKKGLISALNDQSSGDFFERLKNGSPYSTGATGLGIGTGAANSVLLGAHLHNAANYAVKHCLNYAIDGFSDWFLPSRDELTAMYFRRYIIGGFFRADYWSSSEINWKEAYSVRFSDGYITDRDKDHIFRIRAIRAFDDTTQTYNQPVTVYSPANTKLQFLAAETKAIKNAFLVFSLKSSIEWLSDSAILIESFTAGKKTGSAILNGNNSLGFNSNVSTYQQISIPLEIFGFNISEITAFTFRLVNSWKNLTVLNFDTIHLQYDAAQIKPKLEVTEDMNFEYRDLPDGAVIYTIDPDASFNYRVKEMVIFTNIGTVTLAAKINGTPIGGLSFTATSTKQTVVSLNQNSLIKGDVLTLEIISTANLAAAIVGKFRFIRL